MASTAIDFNAFLDRMMAPVRAAEIAYAAETQEMYDELGAKAVRQRFGWDVYVNGTLAGFCDGRGIARDATGETLSTTERWLRDAVVLVAMAYVIEHS